MSVTAKVLVPSKYVENAQTTQYTATNVTAIIDKCVIHNTTGSTATVSFNIVTSGGAAGASNRFITTLSLQGSETTLCPEIVGQVLQSGDFLSAIAGTASALTFRVSGREIS